MFGSGGDFDKGFLVELFAKVKEWEKLKKFRSDDRCRLYNNPGNVKQLDFKEISLSLSNLPSLSELSLNCYKSG